MSSVGDEIGLKALEPPKRPRAPRRRGNGVRRTRLNSRSRALSGLASATRRGRINSSPLPVMRRAVTRTPLGCSAATQTLSSECLRRP